MSTKKYICTVLLTSKKMPNETRTTFQPGDKVEERFIAASNVEKYLKTGILKEMKNTTSTVGK